MNISIIGLILAATNGGQDNQIQVLRELVHELREEVAELKEQQSGDWWLNEQRANEIRSLVQEVLADADTRVNLLDDRITAGYEGGAYLASVDGNWKLKINGQIQARWLYNNADGQASQRGFEQRRTKIKFSGHIFDSSWTYKVSTTWGRGGGSNTEDAWITKHFENGQWFKFGQFKSWFLRENIVSSSKQLGVERSALNNGFTHGWTQGFSTGWQNDDVNLTVQYTDGSGGSNTPALGPSTNTWIARAEFRFGEATWKDFDYLTSKPAVPSGLMVGVAYETFDTDIVGGIEYGNANADESSGWTVDASFRGDGWNIFAYAVKTTGKNRTTGIEQDSSGWLVQGGYLLDENFELIAQYQEGEIDNAAFLAGSSNMRIFRVGFNYWPVTGNNNLKWSTDVGWANDPIADGGALTGIGSADWISTGNGWRADTGTNGNQFLLRTQLQLLF